MQKYAISAISYAEITWFFSYFIKGVFINTLVGGWAIENFCQTFLTPPPFASRQNFLNPPQQVLKTFWPPPIATCIISVSFLNTNLFGMHHRCTSITGNT